MNTIIKTIITLKSDKYSENLRKWLVKFLNRGSLRSEVIVVRSNGEWRRYYVGYFHDGSFIGSPLGQITTVGSRAEVGSWCHFRNWKPVKSFWKRYLKRGICIIDPKHLWYESRWQYLRNGLRQCRHCGMKQKKIIRCKVVRQAFWI